MAEKIASFYTELRESEYLSKIHYDESQTIMNLILCAAKHIEDEDILNIICRKLFVCELDESNKKDVSILIKNVCYVWNSANEKGYSPDNKDYIPVEEKDLKTSFVLLTFGEILPALKKTKYSVLIWKELLYQCQMCFCYTYNYNLRYIIESFRFYHTPANLDSSKVNGEIIRLSEYQLIDFYRRCLNEWMVFPLPFITKPVMIPRINTYGEYIMNQNVFLDKDITEKLPEQICTTKTPKDLIVPLSNNNYSNTFIIMSLLSERYFPLLLRWIYSCYQRYQDVDPKKFDIGHRAILRILRNIVGAECDFQWPNYVFAKNAVDLFIFMWDLRSTIPVLNNNRLFAKQFPFNTEFKETFPKRYCDQNDDDNVKKICALSFTSIIEHYDTLDSDLLTKNVV